MPLTLGPSPTPTRPPVADEIESRIWRIFREELHVDVPAVDTDLLAAGTMDSLTFVQLLVRIEEEFGRRIPVEELQLDDLRSIARIASLLQGGPSS